MLMVLICLFPQGMTAVFTIVFVFSLFAAFAVWLIKYGSKLLKNNLRATANKRGENHNLSILYLPVAHTITCWVSTPLQITNKSRPPIV